MAERASAPENPEVGCMSRVCEMARRDRNLPVWSRNQSELIGQCLRTNDPGAWRAMADDIHTRDFDAETVAEYINADQDKPAMLAACFTESRAVESSYIIFGVVTSIAEHLHEDARTAFCDALAARFMQTMATFSGMCQAEKPGVALEIAGALQSMLATTRFPPDVIETWVRKAIRNKRYDLAAVVAAHVTFPPDMFDAIVATCESAVTPTQQIAALDIASRCALPDTLAARTRAAALKILSKMDTAADKRVVAAVCNAVLAFPTAETTPLAETLLRFIM